MYWPRGPQNVLTCPTEIGDFKQMANLTATPAARIALVLSLSTLLGACSLGKNGEQVSVNATPAATAESRFTEEGSFTAVDQPQQPIRVGNINADAPKSYTVVKGDTLWDISDRFLNQAWLWPQIWDYNPQIKNPHLIYPGDLIAVEYVNGQPRLVIERDGQRVSTSSSGIGGSTSGLAAERLSPRIRAESLDDAIPMIPGDAIASFLVHPRVVPLSAIRNAPYVVGNYDGRLISAIGHQIYVRGELNRDQPRYAVFRKSKKLEDPVTRKTLGYEVQHVSDVKLMHLGDPSTLIVTSNNMETIKGDMLLATNDDNITHNYETRMPALGGGEGRVVSLVNAISQSGRDQVVVINLGKKNKIKPGDVLAIETHGGSFIDMRGKRSYEEVKMPNTRTGVVMVFKTFDDVSYALVMESTLPVRVNDIVTGI